MKEDAVSGLDRILMRGWLAKVSRGILAARELPVLIGLLVISLVFSVSTPFFLTPLNLFQLTRQMAVLAVISIGMTYVISTGEIDISVGGMFNLANNVMAVLIGWHHVDPWVACLAALAVGMGAGALNGALSVSLGLPTLIVTLGTVNLFRGLTMMVSKGMTIGNLPSSTFFAIGAQGFGPITYVAIAALAVVIGSAWLFRNTLLVRQLLAIGSGPEAARRVGVGVGRRKIQVMTINGLLCGVAAILGLAVLGSASPQSGIGYEMSAIAATVVGGTSLSGGKGTIWGTLLGITLIMAIQNGLMLIGLPSAWQVVSTGVLLLAAVGVQQLVRLRSHQV
jgi:ribose/xylose/arabinose/galactoside ABC-type transport system permease subunit